MNEPSLGLKIASSGLRGLCCRLLGFSRGHEFHGFCFFGIGVRIGTEVLGDAWSYNIHGSSAILFGPWAQPTEKPGPGLLALDS